MSKQRPSHRHGERHGRYASDGAVSGVSGVRANFTRPRNRDRATVGGQLHHKPRNGWLLDYASEGRRRIAVVVGRSRADSGAAMGNLTTWPSARRMFWRGCTLYIKSTRRTKWCSRTWTLLSPMRITDST